MRTNLTVRADERTLRAEVPRVLLTAGLLLLGVGALTAGAWLSVPFYPVPLTMQTLAVLLVGGFLGPTLGASTVAAYLFAGAMGAPVFHGGLGGMAVLLGPTGGYLVGFLPAACVMGLAARRLGTGTRPAGESTRRLASVREILILAVGALLAGVVIYCFGVPWLSLFTGSSLSKAVAVGLVPFLLGDLLKTAVAVAALRLGIGALSRRGLLPF